MAYVTIQSIDKTERTNRSGKVNPGLLITGIKHGYKDDPDEPYDLFLPDWCESDTQMLFSEVRLGFKYSIKMEKQGNFWKVISVEPVGGAPAATGTPAPASPAPAPVPVSSLQAAREAKIDLTPMKLDSTAIAVLKALEIANDFYATMLDINLVKPQHGNEAMDTIKQIAGSFLKYAKTKTAGPPPIPAPEPEPKRAPAPPVEKSYQSEIDGLSDEIPF